MIKEEKTQLLTTQLWLEMVLLPADSQWAQFWKSQFLQEWIDYRLKWDPFDPSYDNITEIQMSPAQLWTPDIVLYNELEIN